MKPSAIIIHCSDSRWGNAWHIDTWHRGRGFKWGDGNAIGYHWVVCNGRISPTGYHAPNDGLIEDGRPERIAGAHVQGRNHDTLGVCLIGKEVATFTSAQLTAASNLVAAMCIVHGLGADDVLGHCETESGKAQGKLCPVYPMPTFRALVADVLAKGVSADVAQRYEKLRDRNMNGAIVDPSWRPEA